MVIIIITFLILYFLLNHICINMYVHVKFYFNRYIYCSLLLYQVLTCPQILAQKASSSQGLQLSSANLVADILTPVQVLHTPHVNIDSSASDESSDDEPASTVTSVCTVPAPRPLPLPQRPQVGMKTPKSSFPPKRCINVMCKEEKQALKEEIALLKAEIDDCK